MRAAIYFILQCVAISSATAQSVQITVCPQCDKQVIFTHTELLCVSKSVTRYIEAAKKTDPVLFKAVSCSAVVLQNDINKAKEQHHQRKVSLLTSIGKPEMRFTSHNISAAAPTRSTDFIELKGKTDNTNNFVAVTDPTLTPRKPPSNKPSKMYILSRAQVECLISELPTLIKLPNDPVVFIFDHCAR